MHKDKLPIFVFDFDGTLCDSFRAVVDCLNSLSGEYGYEPISPEEENIIREQSIRAALKIKNISLAKLPGLVLKVRSKIRSQIPDLQPFDGIREALSELSHSHSWGVLTSNSVENVQKFIEAHNLPKPEFCYSGKSLFGKDKVIKKMLREQNLSANSVLYLGDEIRDVEACKKVGVRVAAVTWGFQSKQVLEKSGPDLITEQPRDIPSLSDRFLSLG